VRNYASISPLFWTKGSGKKLRGHKEGQLVALYLMSSPATSMVGIFHLSLPTLCHETGLSTEEALKGLARCSDADVEIAFWDEDEELVFVPALARHQIGESLKPRDHKIKGIERALAPFKGHRFYVLFLDRYATAYRLGVEGASESLQRDNSPVPDLVPVPVPAGESEGRQPVGAPRRWTKPPVSFEPTAEHEQLAQEHGADYQLELANFRDHTFDTPRADADAEFRKWLRNSRPRSAPRASPRGGPPALSDDDLRRARNLAIENAEAGRYGPKAREAVKTLRGAELTAYADRLAKSPPPAIRLAVEA
jgi:hypothetical protein